MHKYILLLKYSTISVTREIHIYIFRENFKFGNIIQNIDTSNICRGGKIIIPLAFWVLGGDLSSHPQPLDL